MPTLDAQVGIRLPKALKARLEQQARKEMRSVSNMIVAVMEEYLDRKEKEQQ